MSAKTPLNLEPFKVPAGATAAQAVAAYQRFTQSDVAAALRITDAETIKALREELRAAALTDQKKVAPALLTQLEGKLGFRFPPSLRDFYIQVGSFAADDLQGLVVFEPKDDEFFANEFANYQFENMFARHSQLLSAQDVKAIRDQFFFFALGSYEDDGGHARMLYFHKQQGWFSEVQLIDDDHRHMRETEFPALLGLTAPRATLDVLIVRQFNRMIVRLLSDVAVDRKQLSPADAQLRREANLGKNR